jgi:hypothetical protein
VGDPKKTYLLWQVERTKFESSDLGYNTDTSIFLKHGRKLHSVEKKQWIARSLVRAPNSFSG